MMTWYCTITDWLHANYINGLYSESMSEVTEEIFGLFLLLQMIENDSIKLDTLKLHHEWPNLHNETSFNNYKEQKPYYSLDKIVNNEKTDKKYPVFINPGKENSRDWDQFVLKPNFSKNYSNKTEYII